MVYLETGHSAEIKIGEYLLAELGSHSDSGKTEIWFIRNIDGEELGSISWYSSWRKYAFNSFEMSYEEKCLRSIADFCEKLTKEHKEKIKNGKSK